MKTFEYRLRPTKEQEHRLLCLLEGTRAMYNEALQELIDHYKKTGKHLGRFAHDKLHNKKRHPDLPAAFVDTTILRLHKSFQSFFRGLKKGEDIGFPRYKSFSRWRILEFRTNQNRIEGDCFKSGKPCVGNIKVVVHREMEGEFRHARIVKKPSGWYVQCICNNSETPLPKSHKNVGLDFGINALVADSNGNFVSNEKNLRSQFLKLKRSQRKIFRRQKGSKRRGKAWKEYQRLHERIVSRRKDYLHKVSREYVNKYGLIAVEDLKVKNLVKNRHLSLSIHDASWAMLRYMLSYKAESAGREFVAVSPKFTSQKCSECGEIVQKSLSVRTHLCTHCGYTDDRDTNAAKNILRLGLSLRKPSCAIA